MVVDSREDASDSFKIVKPSAREIAVVVKILSKSIEFIFPNSNPKLIAL